jgi:FtsZ-binding cell division protein ZapB
LGADYGRGLFKQLQDTIEQVEKLTVEIRELKSAHQIETASLKKEIENLRTENTALKAENQKLKAIINKDSSNFGLKSAANLRLLTVLRRYATAAKKQAEHQAGKRATLAASWLCSRTPQTL